MHSPMGRYGFAGGVALIRRLLRLLPIEASYGAGELYARGRIAVGRAPWVKKWAGWEEPSRPVAAQLICAFVDVMQSAGPLAASPKRLAKWNGSLRLEGRTRDTIALKKRLLEMAPVTAGHGRNANRPRSLAALS